MAIFIGKIAVFLYNEAGFGVLQIQISSVSKRQIYGIGLNFISSSQNK